MGFKTKSKQTSQINSNQFTVGGLIFDCEDDYLLLKNIDKNIEETVKIVNEGNINFEDIFNNIKSIYVKESYFDAREELDGLFSNATSLLCYEGTHLINDYKVGCCFFSKINIIEYSD